MHETGFVLNLGVTISFVYFILYSLSLLLFFLIVKKETTYLSNFSSLFLMIKYSKSKMMLAVLTYLAFLGLPPVSLFAPKFAGLALILSKHGIYFFLIALLATFVSFAFYLQVFDLMFDKKTNSKSLFSLIKKQSIKHKSTIIYQDSSIILVIFFLVFFGIFFFKDWVVLITIFV